MQIHARTVVRAERTGLSSVYHKLCLPSPAIEDSTTVRHRLLVSLLMIFLSLIQRLAAIKEAHRAILNTCSLFTWGALTPSEQPRAKQLSSHFLPGEWLFVASTSSARTRLRFCIIEKGDFPLPSLYGVFTRQARTHVSHNANNSNQRGFDDQAVVYLFNPSERNRLTTSLPSCVAAEKVFHLRVSAHLFIEHSHGEWHSVTSSIKSPGRAPDQPALYPCVHNGVPLLSHNHKTFAGR